MQPMTSYYSLTTCLYGLVTRELPDPPISVISIIVNRLIGADRMLLGVDGEAFPEEEVD